MTLKRTTRGVVPSPTTMVAAAEQSALTLLGPEKNVGAPVGAGGVGSGVGAVVGVGAAWVGVLLAAAVWVAVAAGAIEPVAACDVAVAAGVVMAPAPAGRVGTGEPGW